MGPGSCQEERLLNRPGNLCVKSPCPITQGFRMVDSILNRHRCCRATDQKPTRNHITVLIVQTKLRFPKSNSSRIQPESWTCSTTCWLLPLRLFSLKIRVGRNTPREIWRLSGEEAVRGASADPDRRRNENSPRSRLAPSRKSLYFEAQSHTGGPSVASGFPLIFCRFCQKRTVEAVSGVAEHWGLVHDQCERFREESDTGRVTTDMRVTRRPSTRP